MQQQLDDLVTLLTEIFNGDTDALARFGESPVDYLDAQTDAAGAVDPTAIVAEALAGSGLDPATQQAVLDAVEASSGGYETADNGYTNEQLAEIFAQGINITVEEGDEIFVDNGLYVEGDVKGGIHQQNATNLTQADDGAVIANGAVDSNFQTGEGNTQLNDVYADNVISGEGNTVASGASTIGNENVKADYIDNSEFGAGDQDRSVDADVYVKDSFTDDDVYKGTYSDDDVVDTKVDVDVAGGYKAAPEPYEPEPVYEADPEPEYYEPEPEPYKPEPVYEAEPEPEYYEPEPDMHCD